MLVDAAKQGDVEIPYFCYEPKLGHPVGACRMCLVEIEGIPKLQTSCSTPVKDGMVVHTQTDRVRHAQNAIVEFLLVNHPLDCPVCDKGGECPLQDITFGWGLGRSRMIEPKRHFEKPLALSPLVAIDRERCILCYRCVRFSPGDRRGLPADLRRARRAHVRRHPRRPSVRRAVQRQHHRAVPGRARSRRSRTGSARGRGTSRAPAASARYVRRSATSRSPSATRRVVRVLGARLHRQRGRRRRLAVRQGPIRLPGDPRRRADHAPLVRDGGDLREISWERAFEAAPAIAKPPRPGRRARRRAASNEEGFLLQRLLREGLHSHDIDSRRPRTAADRLHAREALASPALQATVPDIEFAHTVLLLGVDLLDDAPILDLRIRKGVRRNGVKLAVATARPSALDPNADGRRALRARRRGGVLSARCTRALDREPGLGQTIATLGRAAARRRRGRRDRLRRADRRRGRGRAAADRRSGWARRTARRRAARDPGRRQRPRPARGGRVPDAGPGYAGRRAGRTRRRARSAAAPPTAS